MFDPTANLSPNFTSIPDTNDIKNWNDCISKLNNSYSYYFNECFIDCLKNRKTVAYTALTSLAPLLNLKKPSEISSFGGGKSNKSLFTSFDKRFNGKIPFANPNSGFKIRKGTVGRVKYVGRLGSTIIIIGAFSIGYTIGTVADCANSCTY